MHTAFVAFVPAPHPAIARSHHGGSGTDVPTGYVIAYVAVALLVWIGTAVVLARHTDKRGEHDWAPGEAVALSAVAAMMWPLLAVAAGVWLLVVLATRPKTTARKEL